VASIGLLNAIDRYDSTRGAAFSSFAVPTILGELRRYLRDHTWSVRVSRDLQELSLRAGPATDELAARLGRPPTVPEIAAALDVSPEQMLEARQALTAHSPRSLDEPAKDDEEQTPRGNLLGREDPELAAVEDAVLLESYLAPLPARTRELLRLRFEADLRQDEIAAVLGISQAHVSRLLRESIEELHEIATGSRSAEARGLHARPLGQLRARDAGREPEVVLDARRGAGLAAHGDRVEEHRVQPLGRRVDGGTESGGSGADHDRVVDAS
jgi:RNA polymerase sigma-B factor